MLGLPSPAGAFFFDSFLLKAAFCGHFLLSLLAEMTAISFQRWVKSTNHMKPVDDSDSLLLVSFFSKET